MDIKTHLLTHSTKEKPYKCEQCSHSTITKFKLKRHLEIVHIGVKPYKCETCEMSFSYSRSLRAHRDRIHGNGVKKYNCDSCEYKAFTEGNLYKHIKTKHSEIDRSDKKCEVCHKTLKGKENLRLHMKNSHSGTIFKCTKCDETFKSAQLKSRHIRLMHELESPYRQCDICGKSLKYYNLLEHRKGHIESPKPKTLQCDQCEYKANNSGRLADHKKQVHSDERPFKCDLCPKSFKLIKRQREHVKIVHSHERKRFPFDKCDFATFTNRALVDHINAVHLGIKAYKCDQCGKSFTQQTHLSTHKKSVHSANEYQCKHCDKKFNNSNARVRHDKLIHQGGSMKNEKYKCT